MKNSSPRRSDKTNAIIRIITLIAIIMVLNFLGQMIYTRFDLTKEKRYTISDASKALLKKNTESIYIKVYLDGNLPSGFLRLKNSTKDILQEFKSYSKAKIQIDFINPFEKANTDAEKKAIYEQLIEKGLMPTNLKLKSDESYSEKIIFPAALVNVGELSIPVQLLENQIGYGAEQALNNSVILLEFKFASAIKKLTQRGNPTITFIHSYGALPPVYVSDFKRTLAAAKYNVEEVDITAKHISKTGDSVSNWINPLTDVIVIAKPLEKFSEKDKFRIDQYLLGGGKILWLIDAVTAEMDMIRNDAKMFMAQGKDLNLDDMLFKYGVRINKNLVQDAQLNNPIPIIDQTNMQPMLFPWLYFPLLTPSNQHAIGKNLDPIAGYFASSIDTINNGIKKSILLTTSENSKALPEPIRIHLAAIKDKPDYQYFKQKNLIMGVLLEGKFTSLFKNRLDYAFMQNLAENKIKVLEEGMPSKMIVLSDGDLIKNDVSKEGAIYPLGYNQFTNQTMSNKDFLMNCIEYLVDDNGLIETRNKEIKLRLLDKSKTKDEQGKWQLINILIPLFAVIFFGIYYSYRRKKQYAS